MDTALVPERAVPGQFSPGFPRGLRGGLEREVKDRNSNRAVSLWKFAGIGVDLAAAVAGFTLLGWLADRHWGVYPRWTVTGAVLGLVGGMYNLVRQSLAAVRGNAPPPDRSPDPGDTNGEGASGDRDA